MFVSFVFKEWYYWEHTQQTPEQKQMLLIHSSCEEKNSISNDPEVL